MRRYRDLIVPPDDLGPTLDWWDALPIVTEVMNLVRAGDAGGATDLLRWGLPEYPALLDCLIEILVDHHGKKPTGAPAKNTEWRLLGIYDFYNLNTHGRESERMDQLAAEYRLSVSTMADLLAMGRQLGIKLEAQRQAAVEDDQISLRETPESEPDNWNGLLPRADRLIKPTG